MSKRLAPILIELAEASVNGASEREIETDVVQAFREVGWPRTQIRQDVSVSDRANDKVDILLSVGEQPMILVEVKRHGSTRERDAEGQVKRYCALRKPQLAVLTDGVRWVLYLAGRHNILPLLDATTSNQANLIAEAIAALNPDKMQQLVRNGSLQYLDIIEGGFQGISQETQSRLRPFFIATAANLLLPMQRPSADEALTYTEQAEPMPSSTVQVISTASPSQSAAIQGRLSASQLEGTDGPASSRYNPLQPPDLKHTRLVTAEFNGATAREWNSLLRTAVLAAVRAGRSADTLSRLITAQLNNEGREGNGYTVIPGTGISVQGVEARRAWSDVIRIAQELQVGVEVTFRWQDKEGAAHPGNSGSMRWSPTSHG